MSKSTISRDVAQELREAGFSLAEIVEQYDIDLTAGEANVQAAQAQVPVNEGLLATAKELFAAGHKAENTKRGRATRVLGREDGIAPYSIVVYGPTKG